MPRSLTWVPPAFGPRPGDTAVRVGRALRTLAVAADELVVGLDPTVAVTATRSRCRYQGRFSVKES